jgi:putative ABC transport system permease protein
MSFSAGGREVSARVMAVDIPGDLNVDAKLKARYFPPAGTMIIDKILAAKEDLHEGQTVRLNDVELTIGPVQPRSSEAFQPFAFVNYADAQQIFGVQGVVNFGMVMVEAGSDVSQVGNAIGQAVPTVQTFTKDQFARAIRKEIDDSFLPIIGIILAIGFTVGAAVVGLTLYTATIEHAREFGVMKAVGASGSFMYRIVATQSVMLTAAGFLVGLVGSLVVARLATSAVPDFATDFRSMDVVSVFVVMAAMAFLASLLPVRRINSIDPAMVFKA